MFKCTSFLHAVHYGLPFPGHPGSPTFFVPEFPGMKLTQLPGTCCKANLLQRLNDCYLMPAKCGTEGVTVPGREMAVRGFVRESSRAPRVHRQAYTIRRCADDWATAAGLPLGCCQTAAAD